MTSVAEIIRLFQSAADEKSKVDGPPNDNHTLKFKEDLLNVSFQITFEGTDGDDPSGAILADGKYKAVNATAVLYDWQLAARANYDASILENDPARCSKEENWSVGTQNQARKRTIERGACVYLLALVDKTWLRPLKNKITFYTKVNPIKMLAQITTSSGRIKRVDIIDLLVSLAHLWKQDPRVPQYLKTLKDAQKKSVRAGLPFTDDLLTTIGSSSLLKEKSFPKDRATWDVKDPAEQTLKASEEFFLSIHKGMERECRLAGVRADVFGSAAAAIRGHGIKPRPTATAGAAGALGPDASFMAQFDAHFTALSAAASGSNVEQESLATAATTQYSAIIYKLEALELLYVAPGGGGGNGRNFTSDDRAKAAARINQLQAAIRGSWITGSASKFCSTHGWGLGTGHESTLCKNKTK